MSDVSVQAIVNPDKKVRLDIRAVRGPKTAAVLRENGFTFDETYGDPAILMPLIYSTKVPKQKGKVVIIPHESRYRDYADRYANVLNTYTRDYKRFIDEIASAEKVISSSLHGIILAESYGTPAFFLNDYPGARFKYEDYYASTGREVFPMVDTVEEAERISGEINPVLKEMQAKLLSTFPTDIFHKRN